MNLIAHLKNPLCAEYGQKLKVCGGLTTTMGDSIYGRAEDLFSGRLFQRAFYTVKYVNGIHELFMALKTHAVDNLLEQEKSVTTYSRRELSPAELPSVCMACSAIGCISLVWNDFLY
ncbi:MAG: hypothetical protein LC660_14605 [Desulfobacteraceae bacterium]|nr:hypothetical protein [Desulfobacteraceae bacterium]